MARASPDFVLRDSSRGKLRANKDQNSGTIKGERASSVSLKHLPRESFGNVVENALGRVRICVGNSGEHLADIVLRVQLPSFGEQYAS